MIDNDLCMNVGPSVIAKCRHCAGDGCRHCNHGVTIAGSCCLLRFGHDFRCRYFRQERT